MTDNDRKKVEEIKATMRIEGMELDNEDIKMAEDIITGKITVDEAVENIKKDIYNRNL